MSGVTYHIEGLKELQAKLDALPVKLAKRVVRPALEDAGAIVQQEAGVNAPRKTGNLTVNIVSEVTVHNDLTAEVHVGPDKSAFYGLYSELGTAPHDETSKDGMTWRHPGEPARPWLRPAFDATKGECLEVIIQDIRDGLDDVVGK
jgi:HK97 gp10 family phage protein